MMAATMTTAAHGVHEWHCGVADGAPCSCHIPPPATTMEPMSTDDKEVPAVEVDDDQAEVVDGDDEAVEETAPESTS